MPPLSLLRTYIDAFVPMLASLTAYAWFYWIYATFPRGAQAVASSPTMTPPPSRHPEPLAAWTRALCAVIDAEGLWLDAARHQTEAMLRCWSVSDSGAWKKVVLEKLPDTRDGMSAWNGICAIRLIMAGARVGWCGERFAWGATRAIGVELARRYASFADVGTDYVIDRRRCARLPLDGMFDDPGTRECAARVGIQRWTPPSISFTAFLDAPAHAKLPDIDALRVAMGAASKTSAPPALPALARCAFCRDVFRGRPRMCPSCGAPTADALTVERRRLRA